MPPQSSASLVALPKERRRSISLRMPLLGFRARRSLLPILLPLFLDIVLPAVLIAWFSFLLLKEVPELAPRRLELPNAQWANPRLSKPYMADFLVFYTAGKEAREHRQGIYDPVQASHDQANITGQNQDSVRILPFFNPPASLLAFSLVSLIPPTIAAELWGILGLLGFSFCFFTVLKTRLSTVQPLTILIGGLALFASYPFFQMTLYGQITPLYVAGLALVWQGFFRRNEDHLGILGLLVLALKPVLVLPVLFYLAITGRWRSIFTFCFIEIALTLVAMLVFYPSLLIEYIRLSSAAINWDEVNGISVYGMFGWRALVRGIGGSDAKAIQTAVVLLLSSGTLLVLWASNLRRHRWDAEERFAAVTFATLLISPHSYIQDLLLIALPLALLATGPARRPGWLAISLGLWFAVYFHFQVLDATGVGLANLALPGIFLISIASGWRSNNIFPNDGQSTYDKHEMDIELLPAVSQ